MKKKTNFLHSMLFVVVIISNLVVTERQFFTHAETVVKEDSSLSKEFGSSSSTLRI